MIPGVTSGPGDHRPAHSGRCPARDRAGRPHGSGIAATTDEGGAIASQGRHHAWSAALRTARFHTAQAEAVAASSPPGQDTGPAVHGLMTWASTFHATRTTATGPARWAAAR